LPSRTGTHKTRRQRQKDLSAILEHLAIISLARFEREQLAELLKFFPFGEQTRWFYLYSDSSNEEELPRHPNFIPKAFAGSDPVPQMLSWLEQEGLTSLCFAGRTSARIWFHAQRKPFITLYHGENLLLADLGALESDFTQQIEKLCDGLGLHAAILRSEAPTLGKPSNSVSYDDFAAFRNARCGGLLCTQNSDLISSICDSTPFSVMNVADGMSFPNLDLREGAPDFLTALGRLSQAPELAGETAPLGRNLNALLNSYSFFALYYDNYMYHVNYEHWVDLILSWHRRIGGEAPKRILELACGTANAASILVFRGYETHACDSSPFMLHVADTKTFKPKLFYHSLTEPIPQAGFDLIFCLFDSFNYLTKKADAAKLLKNASQALKPGGTFIFDISTLRNSLDNFSDNTSFTRVRDGYMLQISTYEPLTYRQLTHFYLFRKKLNVYERFEERHVQRVWMTSELIQLCAASDLELKAIFAPETRPNLLNRDGSDIDNRYFRLFFLLHKPV